MSQLESTCRLCGKDRALPGDRHPLQKLTYQKSIIRVIGLDVSQDHAACPPYICVVCSLRLKKGMKIKNKKMSGSVPTWDVPTFNIPQLPTAGSDEQQTFANLVQMARTTAHRHGLVDLGTDGVVVIAKLEPVTVNTIFRLAVFRNLSWQLEYMGQRLPFDNTLLDTMPGRMDCLSLETIAHAMSTVVVCTGHSDLSKVMEQCSNTGKLVSHDQKTVVAVYSHGSVRSPECRVLMSQGSKNGLCVACCQSDFRSNLRARESYLRKEKSPSTTSSTSKFTPNAKLTETEKRHKLKLMGETVRKLQRKVKTLEAKVEQMLQDESVEVDETQHRFLTRVCKDEDSSVVSNFSEGSAQRLLWEQQLKRQKAKGVKGMRWHPTVVRWCISMFAKSPAAYRQLAQSGFLFLPGQSTLKAYLNFTKSVPDINIDVLKIVVNEFDLLNENVPEFQTNVTLVWDEMKIKSGLVVSKGSGMVVGFCSLDNFNEELKKLSDLEKPTSKEPELATHIIVFMVRGMMCKANIPFLWYPCVGFNADQLWGVVWKATRALEDLRLRVRAWTCDGATPNRKFFRVNEALGGQYQGITYYTVNRFAPNRVIYFICDVPHLVKTVRNNLENSHGHNNSKSLMKDGQSIRWPHIVNTVEEDMRRGLVRLPRLKEEHIHLSPQLRMRVGLAAQVLSSSMAKALLAREHPELSKTAEFCQIFDKWFDCLNGRSRYGPKPDLNAYSTVHDARLTWLNDVFLEWLNSWEREIQGLDLSKSEQNRHLLSYQTVEGLKITTNSFVALTRDVLSEPGAAFLIPEKLNQDRLEVFFSKLRRGCGDSDNPTVEEARHRILALIVAGRSIMAPRQANSVVDEEVETSMYMPRCKRSRKQ